MRLCSAFSFAYFSFSISTCSNPQLTKLKLASSTTHLFPYVGRQDVRVDGAEIAQFVDQPIHEHVSAGRGVNEQLRSRAHARSGASQH